MLAPLPAFLPGSRAWHALLVGVLLASFVRTAHAAAPEPKPRAASAVCGEDQIVATPRVERKAEPLRDEEPAWCVSADDPRCAPLHKDAAHHTLALRVVAAAETFTFAAPVPPPAKQQARTPRTGLSPRAGVSQRVERPPRASRRPS